MITKEEYDKLENYIIVLDTNIFMHLCQVPDKISTEFIEIIKKYQDRIWVPRQVYKEFRNNYQTAKGSKKKIFTDFNINMKNIVNSGKNDTLIQMTELQKKFFDTNDIKNKISSLFSDIEKIIKLYVDNNSSELEKSKVTGKYEEVLSLINSFDGLDRIGEKITFSERLKILKEGEIRYKYNIPPGYKDLKKNDKNKDNNKEVDEQAKFGDLFIWKEILKYSSKTNKNIIFITDDAKEDWWKKDGDELIDLREELKEEFVENCPNLDIKFLTMENFYRLEIDNLSNHAKLFLGYHSYLTKLKNEGKLSIIDSYLSDNKNRLIEQSGMDIFCKDNDINLSDVSTIINNIEWDIGGTFLAVKDNEIALINIFLTGKINFDIKYSFSYQTQVDSFLMGSADAYIKIVDNELSNDYTINNIGFTVYQYNYRDGLMTTLNKILNNENDSEDYGNFFHDEENEDSDNDKNSL